MLAADEEAVVCDLAETYGILDYRALPVSLLATLCSGLRENSRIKIKLSGAGAKTDTILLAAAADRLSTLVWMQSEDGAANRNRPKSILKALLGDVDSGESVQAFDTAEDYEAAKAAILGVAQ